MLQFCEARGVTDKEALDLLEKLLALNPAARISAHGAVTVRGAAAWGENGGNVHVQSLLPTQLPCRSIS